jgi:hypothetical protein
VVIELLPLGLGLEIPALVKLTQLKELLQLGGAVEKEGVSKPVAPQVTGERSASLAAGSGDRLGMDQGERRCACAIVCRHGALLQGSDGPGPALRAGSGLAIPREVIGASPVAVGLAGLGYRGEKALPALVRLAPALGLIAVVLSEPLVEV